MPSGRGLLSCSRPHRGRRPFEVPRLLGDGILSAQERVGVLDGVGSPEQFTAELERRDTEDPSRCRGSGDFAEARLHLRRLRLLDDRRADDRGDRLLGVDGATFDPCRREQSIDRADRRIHDRCAESEERIEGMRRREHEGRKAAGMRLPVRVLEDVIALRGDLRGADRAMRIEEAREEDGARNERQTVLRRERTRGTERDPRVRLDEIEPVEESRAFHVTIVYAANGRSASSNRDLKMCR